MRQPGSARRPSIFEWKHLSDSTIAELTNMYPQKIEILVPSEEGSKKQKLALRGGKVLDSRAEYDETVSLVLVGSQLRCGPRDGSEQVIGEIHP